jgi:geranylgeranyl diphosphate synthase type II
MSENFAHHLAAKRALVEEYLPKALSVGDEAPARLFEAMGYGLLAPGKRMRPLLVLLAAEAGGGRDKDALPAAAAVEMIHAYSLIHDDLPAMDDDDWRRGRPTCHKQFGEALAILAGDALLTLAFQVVAEGYHPVTAAAMSAELARGAGAAGMVGGQVEDLTWEKRLGEVAEPRAPLKELENIHARKTGALFRSCLRLGLLSAQGENPGGADAGLKTCLDGYGLCFGQAFQITDDLLDVQGNIEQTGKRVQKDAAHGKLTYPGLVGVEESKRLAADLCRRAREHLAPLGAAGGHLAALVPFLLERDR